MRVQQQLTAEKKKTEAFTHLLSGFLHFSPTQILRPFQDHYEMWDLYHDGNKNVISSSASLVSNADKFTLTHDRHQKKVPLTS